ncbi:rod shape-determining protein MreD [Streptosporangiaceae bacterium NEAU-GS5]|nr:rod shape-determining protein MreD [Streptosporangiaceae bacterium NEAU-GS5]
MIPRNVLAALLIVVVLVVQVTVINRLPIPVTPDLALVTVIALGAVRGAVAGAVIGFCAGLLADLQPPSDHALGQYALVMCLAGFAAGRWAGRWPLTTVAVCAVTAPAVAMAVGALLGDPGVDWAAFRSAWPPAALADLLAAPILVWVVTALHRERASAATVAAWRPR